MISGHVSESEFTLLVYAPAGQLQASVTSSTEQFKILPSGHGRHGDGHSDSTGLECVSIL